MTTCEIEETCDQETETICAYCGKACCQRHSQLAAIIWGHNVSGAHMSFGNARVCSPCTLAKVRQNIGEKPMVTESWLNIGYLA